MLRKKDCKQLMRWVSQKYSWKKKIQRKVFGRLKCRGNGNQQKTRKLMN